MMKDSNATTNFNGMTQEEKDLVLQDLCARLPYGVKFATKYSHFNDTHELLVVNKHSTIVETFKMLWWDIEDVKPYLRPISSMTEEEMIVFLQVRGLSQVSKRFINDFKNGNFGIMANMSNYARNIDWLNKKMFDFRGLIPKDLALSTEKYNPYKD